MPPRDDIILLQALHVVNHHIGWAVRSVYYIEYRHIRLPREKCVGRGNKSKKEKKKKRYKLLHNIMMITRFFFSFFNVDHTYAWVT